MKAWQILFFVWLTFAAVGARAQTPTVSIIAGDIEVRESERVDLILMKTPGIAATVQIEFKGSATENTDYRFFAPKLIHLPAEVSEFKTAVYTINDVALESAETIEVHIVPSAAYNIGLGFTRILVHDSRLFPTVNDPPYVRLLVSETLAPANQPITLTAQPTDQNGVAAVWFVSDSGLIGKVTNAPWSLAWTNRPPGVSHVYAFGIDRTGVSGGMSNTPPVEIITVHSAQHPPAAGYSRDGLSLNVSSSLMIYFNSNSPKGGIIAEFPIPQFATNLESQLEFRIGGANSIVRDYSVLIGTYPGNGGVSLSDFEAFEPLQRITFRTTTNALFRVDMTRLTTNLAGAVLGVRFQPEHNPAIPDGLASVTGLRMIYIEGFADSPAHVKWADTNRTVSSVASNVWNLLVDDMDDHFVSAEVSVGATILGKWEGETLQGTNTIAVAAGPHAAGTHEVFARLRDEEGTVTLASLGTATFTNLPSKIRWLNPGPSPIVLTTNDSWQFRFEVSDPDTSLQAVELLATDVVVASHSVQLSPGTNFVTLVWTNLAVGQYQLIARVRDSQGVTAAIFVNQARVVTLPAGYPKHVWIGSTDGTASHYVVDDQGTAHVWGRNAEGQLGLGFRTTTFPFALLNPTNLPPPANRVWRQFASRGADAFALTDRGELYAMGRDFATSPMLLTNPQGVPFWIDLAIAHGQRYTLDQDGMLWNAGAAISAGYIEIEGGASWLLAKNTSGELFRLWDNLTMESALFPTNVTSWGEFSTCTTHSLAIGSDGKLYGWGTNTSGNLLLPGSVIEQPKKIPTGDIESFTLVAAGEKVNLAVDNRGRLWSWGAPEYSGAREPKDLQLNRVDVPDEGWLDIAVTKTFAMAVSANENVYLWGQISGDGPNGIETVILPRLVMARPAGLLRFEPATINAQTDFRVKLTAPAGVSLNIERSLDLLRWDAITNLANPSGSAELIQPLTGDPGVFFRVRNQ